MTLIIYFLATALIVTCLFLIMLILAQPPKKDSGAGLAFGGGTADALFGAGSGNALTKITKWASGVFVVLSLILASLQVRSAHGNQSEFEQGVQQQQQQMQTPRIAPPTGTAPQQQGATPSTSPSAPALPLYSATNTPSAPPATTTTNGK